MTSLGKHRCKVGLCEYFFDNYPSGGRRQELDPPLSLLICRLNKPSPLSLCSCSMCSSILTILVTLPGPSPVCKYPFCSGVAQTVPQTWPHRCQIQGNNHFPQPAGCALANTDQYVVSPHCCRRNCRCLFSWLLTSTFLQSYFLSCVSPACTDAWGYDIPGAEFCIYLY